MLMKAIKCIGTVDKTGIRVTYRPGDVFYINDIDGISLLEKRVAVGVKKEISVKINQEALKG